MITAPQRHMTMSWWKSDEYKTIPRTLKSRIVNTLKGCQSSAKDFLCLRLCVADSVQKLCAAKGVSKNIIFRVLRF